MDETSERWTVEVVDVGMSYHQNLHPHKDMQEIFQCWSWLLHSKVNIGSRPILTAPRVCTPSLFAFSSLDPLLISFDVVTTPLTKPKPKTRVRDAVHAQ